MPARAKLPPGEGKRVPLNMRTTQEFRARLEKAAADSGRSLVQEVETRVERSFLVEDHLAVIAGDPATAVFVREMLEAQRLIETHQGKSVWDEFECHEAMKVALNRLLKQHAPKRSRKLEKKLAAHERYVQETLKPWWARGGGGFINNPDAGPMPDLKPSPLDQARDLGREAVKVVRNFRQNALAEALRKGAAQED